MDIHLDKSSTEIPDKFASIKSGKEALKFPLVYLLLIQLLFCGFWISVFNEGFKPFYALIGIVYFILSIGLIVSILKFRRICFGFDSKGLYMKKPLGYIDISWEDLESIEIVQGFWNMSEIDLFPSNYLHQKNRFLYRFKSTNSQITISHYYSEADIFGFWVSTKSDKKIICTKSGQKINWILDNKW